MERGRTGTESTNSEMLALLPQSPQSTALGHHWSRWLWRAILDGLVLIMIVMGGVGGNPNSCRVMWSQHVLVTVLHASYVSSSHLFTIL